jgi:excinuclease ABC subunit C
MVVLEDGLPNKREYRRFKVKDVPGNDDYAAMEEVLTRRLKAYLDERDLPIGERGAKPGKFAYPPQLLLVDGGKGQLGVAERVVASLGLTDEIPIASLAKRFEEVYLPGRSEPVEVPRGSDALFMLQRIRDEAHRFANGFHRELRGKRMTASSLDGIPGLGESRKKKLVQAMGGVTPVKKASLETLKDLSFLPDAVAEAIYTKFHPDETGTPVARPQRAAVTSIEVTSIEGTSDERAEHLGVEPLIGGQALLGGGAEGEVGDGKLVDPGFDVGADEVDQLGGAADE